jgi:hypothetical protein
MEVNMAGRKAAGSADHTHENLLKEIAALKKEVASLRRELTKKASGGADPRVDKVVEYLKIRSSKERNKSEKLKNILNSL